MHWHTTLNSMEAIVKTKGKEFYALRQVHRRANQSRAKTLDYPTNLEEESNVPAAAYMGIPQFQTRISIHCLAILVED